MLLIDILFLIIIPAICIIVVGILVVRLITTQVRLNRNVRQNRNRIDALKEFWSYRQKD